MAEEILVKEPLTRDMIEVGEKLMKALIAERFELAALFWLYKSEVNRWRLIVATPQVDREGPTKTYASIRKIVSRHQERLRELGPFDITALGSSDKLVRTLAGANKRAKLAGQRWPGIHLNNEYIEDMYFYFIDEDIKPLPGTSWEI